MDVAKMRMHNL
jgi:hypothetical protein